MNVYEVVDSAGTNHAGNMSNDEMVQKARTVKAKIDKAEATGDADLLFGTGADLGELLMNNLVPKMLKFTDIMLIRMEKAARKYPENPDWQQFLKELGPVRAKLAQQKKELMKQGVPQDVQDVGETVAGDVGSIAQSMNKGNMIRRNIYNADGTMKNGLDFGNLLGGASKPKKAKKRRV